MVAHAVYRNFAPAATLQQSGRYNRGHQSGYPRQFCAMTDITQILTRIEHGESAASEELLPLVYTELRRLAAARLAQEKPGQTLQATALVHEAYLRLVGDSPSIPLGEVQAEGARWNSRNHFFAAAAEAMRRILVDNARHKASLKHGGQHARQPIDESDIAATAPPDEVIAVHEALDRLTAEDRVAADLVKLHYFGGFSLEEAAELLAISRATAYRRWTYARTWLHAALQEEP
jgi:RNA polymerase sigma factor (TIGR02999 family)